MAFVLNTNLIVSFSGAMIASSKPIAVFSGNVETEVDPLGFSTAARSHVIEQVRF